MNKLIFSASLAIVALLTRQATATPIPVVHGALTITWSIQQQDLASSPQYPGLGKTNITGPATGKTTNVLQIYKSSYTTTTFKNADFISLVANSLKTNFPATSKLVTDGNNVYLVDSTGTNSIANVALVLTVASSNQVTSGMDTVTEKLTKSGETGTANGTSSGNQIIILKYDDSALVTADGTTSTFEFIGESASTHKGSSTTGTNNVVSVTTSGSFTIKGLGFGTVRGKASNIQGTIMGTPAGKYTLQIF